MNENAQKIIDRITAPYILILFFNFSEPAFIQALRRYLKNIYFNRKVRKERKDYMLFLFNFATLMKPYLCV